MNIRDLSKWETKICMRPKRHSKVLSAIKNGKKVWPKYCTWCRRVMWSALR